MERRILPLLEDFSTRILFAMLWRTIIYCLKILLGIQLLIIVVCFIHFHFIHIIYIIILFNFLYINYFNSLLGNGLELSEL